MKYVEPSESGTASEETTGENRRDAAPGRFLHRKTLKRVRTSPPSTPSYALARAYFRSMRAAEMAAWEMTGGDYVRSCFVSQARLF